MRGKAAASSPVAAAIIANGSPEEPAKAFLAPSAAEARTAPAPLYAFVRQDIATQAACTQPEVRISNAVVLAAAVLAVSALPNSIHCQSGSGQKCCATKGSKHPLQAAPSVAPQKTNFPGVPEGKPLGIITIEDVIEELKKEIRAVKGVLLSAKRFTPVSGRTGVAAGA